MKHEKKICFRITARRIAGSVLVVATVVNLIIVGAVSAIAPPPSTLTPTPTGSISATGEILTLPPGVTDTPIQMPSATLTDTPTPTNTQTPSVTSTHTFTPTYTLTASPSSAPCSPQHFWPIYFVQRGDTLFSIALAVGSTVNELMLANCLIDTRIYPGQPLSVPRLPVPSPTFTPSITPTDTSTTRPDNPTDFQNPEGYIQLCVSPIYIYFMVTPYDPQGIDSVTALLYGFQGDLLDLIPMEPDGDTYYGSILFSDKHAASEALYFHILAIDKLGNTTTSNAYAVDSTLCFAQP